MVVPRSKAIQHLSESAAFRVFKCLFALAIVFHQLSYARAFAGPSDALLSLSALCTVLLPAAWFPFVTMLCVQLTALIATLPYVSNHYLLTGLIAASVLGSLLELSCRAGLRDESAGGAYDRIMAPLRFMLFFLYFFAVFHKLNSGYLDPASSCASVHFDGLRQVLPVFHASWLRTAAIYGSLAVEACIPVLLAYRRTRLGGIAIGILFHLLLGMNPQDVFYNFSSIAYVLYFSFISPTAVEAALGKRRNALWKLGGSATVMLLSVGTIPGSAKTWVRDAFLVYALLAVLAIFRLARVTVVHAKPNFRPRLSIGWLFVWLLVINGFSPYLGLKTETSFAMFSNLRTEGAQSNHLIVRRTLPLGFQDDVVRIVRSSDGYLDSLARSDRGLTYFELRRYLSRHPETSLEYERDGRTVSVARAGDHPDLVRPVPWALGKLLRFRPVDLSDASRCAH